MDAQRGPWWAIEDCELFTDRRSVFRTDLHRLHASFRFGPGLEHAVINYRRRGSRLFIDNGALLGSCIPHDIVFARNNGLRKSRRGGESDDGARKHKFLH